MKTFMLKEDDMTFGDAINNLAKYDNGKAFILLSETEFGYHFDDNGKLKQLDIDADICEDNGAVEKCEVENCSSWSLYVDASLDEFSISLTCFDKD